MSKTLIISPWNISSVYKFPRLSKSLYITKFWIVPNKPSHRFFSSCCLLYYKSENSTLGVGQGSSPLQYRIQWIYYLWLLCFHQYQRFLRMSPAGLHLIILPHRRYFLTYWIFLATQSRLHGQSTVFPLLLSSIIMSLRLTFSSWSILSICSRNYFSLYHLYILMIYFDMIHMNNQVICKLLIYFSL